MKHEPSNTTQAVCNAHHARNIAAQLIAAGVYDVVVSPGSRNTPLTLAFDAFAQQKKLRVTIAMDERVAGFMALGMARASQRPVALACTSGSAGAHYLPALMEAQRSGLTLIALTADRPEELQNRGAQQTTHQSNFYRDFVVETLLLQAPSPETELSRATAFSLQRTFRTALEARGSVHVNVAFREPLWNADCAAIFQAPVPTAHYQSTGITRAPSPQAVEELAALQGRGFLYVGPIDAGTFSPATRNDVIALVQKLSLQLQWPIFADAVSPLRQTHAEIVHHGDVLLRDDRFFTSAHVDHVVVLGPWPTSKPFGQWLQRHPEVALTSIPGSIGAIDPWHRVEQTIHGDVEHALEAWSDALDQKPLPPTPASNWRNDVLQLDREIDAHFAAFCDAHPKFEGSIARQLLENLEEKLSLHIGSSMPIRDVDTYSRGAKEGVLLCASRGVNGIDGNISTALGAALATEEPAVLLLGDIAFRHDVGGLLEAMNTQAALTVVVVDNGGGGIFRHLDVAASGKVFEPYFITPQKSDIARMAAGCGARVHALDTSHALGATLRSTLSNAGTDVIVLTVDGAQQVPWRRQAIAEALERAHSLLPTLSSFSVTAQVQL